MEDTLKRRWESLRARVDDACLAARRSPEDVTVLPVSKTFTPPLIRQAVDLGLHRFGENKVQEITDKSEALADCDIDWVMIGHLQRNKVGVVARLAAEVQSVDRSSVAQTLDRHLRAQGRTIDVLVQVKTSDEPSKYGLDPDHLVPFLDELTGYSSMRVRGLMTLAVNTDDPSAIRGCFRRLRLLRDSASAHGHDLPRLSMGMSGDFGLAIAEGATEVRIGTALFGDRAARR